MQNQLYNPQFLAGIAMMNGKSANEALSEAVITAHNQQQMQAAQQKQAQAQYMQQQLPQVLRELAGKNPYEAAAMLAQIGISAQDAAIILERLAPSNSNSIVKGPGGVNYQAMTNADTGEMSLKEIPGQTVNVKNPLSVSELRINATKLKEIDNEARNAEKELRLLHDSEDAFRQFDATSRKYTGAGSLASKYLPKGAENVLYNTKAQGAKQRIDKLNSQLFQNRVQALGARATDAAKREILKGLPSIELTPEAREDVIATKKRENYEQILRSKFFNAWSKKNNRDLNGAEAAFNELITSEPILDVQGRINKSLLKKIPQVVEAYSNEGSFGAVPQESAGEQMEDLYGQFEDITLQEALAEKERRGRR